MKSRILALALAGLLSLGAHSAQADQSVKFDGTTAGLGLADDANLLGRKVGLVRFRVAPDAGSAKGPLLTLVGYKMAMAVGFTDDGHGILVRSTVGDATVTPDAFDASAPHVLAFQLARGSGLLADDQWLIWIDGKEVGAAPAEMTLKLPGNANPPTVASGLIPQEEERVRLTLGGVGFKGVIDQYEVRTPDNLLYSNLTSKGQIVRRGLPATGYYLALDANVGVEQADLTPAFDHDHHGVFKKPTYFGLSHVPAWLEKKGVNPPDDIMLPVDWGAWVLMTPNLDDPTLYSPAENGQAWVGSLRFTSDDETTPDGYVFCSVGYRGATTRPFLRDGQCYTSSTGRSKDPYVQLGMASGGQNVFIAGGHGIPPNFTFTEHGCFDVTNLDLQNLQDTGCHGNPIFRANLDENGQFTVMPPYIVPKGWIYIPNASSEKKAHSSVASDGIELASAYAGNEAQGFTVLGYSESHNRKASEEASDLTRHKQMRAVHQFFARNHTLVVDPEAVSLDECFIYDALRATATQFAIERNQGNVADIPDWAMPSGPPYFNLDQARHNCRGHGSLKTPLSVADLIARYGTHYASAITYGSRTIEDIDFSSSAVSNMVAEHREFADSSGFQFEANLSAGAGSQNGPHAGINVPVKIGSSDENTSNQGSSTRTENSIEGESVGAICYGAPCAQGLPQQGDAPIPVYLDLVRLDYLFAPPFFADPMIPVFLRPVVAAEVSRMLDAERPNLARSVRVIDVGLTARPTCWSDPSAASLTFPAPVPKEDYCSGVLDNTYLSAIVTKPGGGIDLVKPIPLPEGLARPGEGAPQPGDKITRDPPTRMTRVVLCADPSDTSAGCALRRYRLVVDLPDESGGKVLADDAIIGFMLIGGDTKLSTDSTHYYDETTVCGEACVGGDIAMEWPPWEKNRHAFSKALYLYRSRETPDNLTGEVFVEADANKKKVFSMQVSLSLKDSLDVVLGYPGLVVKEHHAPPVSIDTINPSTTARHYPWAASDGLMFGSHDLSAARDRCEAAYGSDNCVISGDGYATKPPNDRVYPSPDERG